MRAHHYQFSHQLLAELVHREPETVLSELSGPLRDGFLFHLWEQLGDSHSERVSAAGLTVIGLEDRDGCQYAIVGLPPPEHPGESFLVGIVHRPGDTRCYVLDQSTVAPGEGTLARIDADGARVNLGPHDPTTEALLSTLVAEMDGGRVMPAEAGSLAPQTLYQPPTQPPKRSGAAKVVVGIAGGCLGLVALSCVGTGLLAWDSGSDFAAEPFQVRSETLVDGDGHEAVRLWVEGGPEHAGYDVDGPGAADALGCSYLYAHDPTSAYGRDDGCTISLAGAPEGDLQYSVTGRGMPSSFFGSFPVGDMPTQTESVVVTRSYRFAWSEPRGATICNGATCTVVFDQGALRLEGAAPGAQLWIGQRHGDAVAVDAISLADSVGLPRVLRPADATARAQIPGVRVILPSGAAIAGSVETPMARVRTELVRSYLRHAEDRMVPEGPVSGGASLWIVGSDVREVRGEPARTSDIARVFVQTSEEVDVRRCGPYIGGLRFNDYIDRTRVDTTVVTIDREAGNVTHRRFRGPVPRCPEFIPGHQTAVRGSAPATAESYVLSRL